MANDLPRWVNFNVTNRCGCRCLHCSLWKTPERNPPGVADWLRAVDGVADWLGAVRVVFSGGEPLESPLTIPLIERAAARGLHTAVATNGFAVDEALARRLAAAGLEEANVSLDGFAPTHDRLRGYPGGFAQVMHAIGYLHDAGVRTNVVTVVMNDNLDEIPELVRFLERDGHVAGVFFQAMAQPFGDFGAAPGWWREHPRFPRDAARARALCDELIAMKRAGAPINNSEIQLRAMQAYFGNPERFTLAKCSVALIGLNINANGEVAFCTQVAPLGDIRDAGVRELATSPAAEKHRALMDACRFNCHLLINCCFDSSQFVEL